MTSPDRQIWSGMLAHLRGHQPTLCRQWFEEIEPLGMNGGVLSLRAHSPVHRDYLQRLCLTPFNDAAQSVSQRLISVQFLGPDDDLPQPTGKEAAAERQPSQGARAVRDPAPRESQRDGQRDAREDPRDQRERMHPDAEFQRVPGRPGHEAPRPGYSGELRRPDPLGLSLVLNPDYAFENFVVGPGNRLAHAAAQAVSVNPGMAYNPYFVHGKVGLGKTHLLQAICLRIKDSNPGARIFYTSCDAFITYFMEAVQAGEMTDFRHTFRDVDVLVIDDIHFLAKRDRTQEEFFHTFNSLYQMHKQIILSSDAPPEEIPDLEDRLVSRFKWGLVASVAPPCYETRVAILKNKARLRCMDMPDDVACHIAGKIDTNIRELEGAVVKLQILSSVEKRPVDLEMARAALGEEPGRTEKQIQIQSIINVVTDYYGIKITDLQSKRRHRSVALPRQVCMFLARKHTRHSLEEIGGYFGGRDHTTVMHAVRTIEFKVGAEADFLRLMKSLEETIKSPNP
ncbi:MAG: chromosomal replication initiator protein DnaA [Pyrinomonadaceae bacterium]|nr:chromosomal replication initiator protein DnaA [Phycisphaerales bacterium]